LTPQNSSSILIVVTGSAKLASGSTIELNTGDVVFVPASLTEVLIQDASAEFCAYRAHTPSPN
jgi:mannose-6-phosphate isomerase class I